MAEFKNIVFCLSLLACFVAVKPQECTPGAVNHLTFTPSVNRLEWTIPTNMSLCPVSAYVVNIFDLENQTQFQFQMAASISHLDPANLELCKNYTFEVHALSERSVIGPSEFLNASTSSGTRLNLALNLNNATLNEDAQLSLTWNPITTGVSRCITYYRVVHWDETNYPIDNYVYATNFTLNKPVPCMEYKFQFSAIVGSPDIEGPLANVTYAGFHAVANPPKLVNIITTSTSVNMTWSVPSYSETHCPLSTLLIDTLGTPTNITNIRIPIQDSALRPNISVSLTALTPNAVYASHVYLQNSAGYSKNVTVTYQTSDNFDFNYETDLNYEY